MDHIIFSREYSGGVENKASYRDGSCSCVADWSKWSTGKSDGAIRDTITSNVAATEIELNN